MTYGREFYTDRYGRSYGIMSSRRGDGKLLYRKTDGQCSYKTTAVYDEPRYSTRYATYPEYTYTAPVRRYSISTTTDAYPKEYSYNYCSNDSNDSEMGRLYTEYQTWERRGRQAEDAYYELHQHAKVSRRILEKDRAWNYPRKYDGHPKQTREWHQTAAWFAREASDSYKMALRKKSEMGDRFYTYDMTYGGRSHNERSSRLRMNADWFAKKYDTHLYSHSHGSSSSYERDGGDHCVSGIQSWFDGGGGVRKWALGEGSGHGRMKYVNLVG